jgi:hypothetical protein
MPGSTCSRDHILWTSLQAANTNHPPATAFLITTLKKD